MKQPRAIVMGGSMAGLLAARVLTDHFEKVVLVERDSFPAGPENRRGVPQGRHSHGLLAGGGQVLERLFPGFYREAVADGAIPADLVRDSRWFFEGGPLARPISGLNGLLASRPFFEYQVRRRVLAIANLEVRAESQVEQLLTTPDRSRITGVRLSGEEIPADLVVDATGRGSKLPEWLESLGYQRAPEENIEIALGYTTRHFRREPRHMNGDAACVIPPTPHGKRGGVMLAQEGNRWTVTLIAHFGNYAPEDLPGFIEWARTLPAPYIYEVVRDAEPLNEPASARFPASRRRRYEMLDRFPQGLLAIGDGVSSFNPIYGQGMSVAAQEAMALGEELAAASVSPDLARRYFRRIAKVVDIPWATAAGNDLRMPEAVGARSAAVNLINAYIARLHRAAHHDEQLSLAFHRVANLLAPPPSILHPRNAIRVLRHTLRGRPAPPSPVGSEPLPAASPRRRAT